MIACRLHGLARRRGRSPRRCAGTTRVAEARACILVLSFATSHPHAGQYVRGFMDNDGNMWPVGAGRARARTRGRGNGGDGGKQAIPSTSTKPPTLKNPVLRWPPRAPWKTGWSMAFCSLQRRSTCRPHVLRLVLSHKRNRAGEVILGLSSGIPSAPIFGAFSCPACCLLRQNHCTLHR